MHNLLYTTFYHSSGLTRNLMFNGSIYYVLYLQILCFYLGRQKSTNKLVLLIVPIFWISVESASKWVQTSLCLVQWFVIYFHKQDSHIVPIIGISMENASKCLCLYHDVMESINVNWFLYSWISFCAGLRCICRKTRDRHVYYISKVPLLLLTHQFLLVSWSREASQITVYYHVNQYWSLWYPEYFNKLSEFPK